MGDKVVRKWLITGGCGFIGTSLISRLLKEELGVHIRVVDNLSVGSRNDLSAVSQYSSCNISESVDSPGVFLIEGDVRDAEVCLAASSGIDCIVHLAANTGVGPSVESPRADMEANVIGTFNMLEAARVCGVRQFVFASSGAPAGVVEPPIHEEMAPHPVSPYGASKLAGEGYCSAYFQSFKINTVALRFGNVYGPRSRHKSSVIAKFIRQALDGEACTVYGDGTQTRDFIYIDDLVDAVLRASRFERGGEIFQIAAGAEITINELIELMTSTFEEMTGREIGIKYGKRRLGDVARNYADTRKAQKQLGWCARTMLRDGLRLTIADLMKA